MALIEQPEQGRTGQGAKADIIGETDQGTELVVVDRHLDGLLNAGCNAANIFTQPLLGLVFGYFPVS